MSGGSGRTGVERVSHLGIFSLANDTQTQVSSQTICHDNKMCTLTYVGTCTHAGIFSSRTNLLR